MSKIILITKPTSHSKGLLYTSIVDKAVSTVA